MLTVTAKLVKMSTQPVWGTTGESQLARFSLNSGRAGLPGNLN
jgi:hypothetical protein